MKPFKTTEITSKILHLLHEEGANYFEAEEIMKYVEMQLRFDRHEIEYAFTCKDGIPNKRFLGSADREIVKEQDIIEFMFNEWFLAAINWSWEKIVNLAQDGVNALFTNYDTGPRMPVSAQNAQAAPVAGGPQPTQPGQSAQAGQSSLRDETALNLLANLPSQLKESISQKYPIYQKGIEDIIRHNIGKAPSAGRGVPCTRCRSDPRRRPALPAYPQSPCPC